MIIIQINSVYFPSGLNRPRIPSISHVLGSLPSLACTPAIAQQYPFAISDQQALLGTTQEDFISNVAASWLDNSDLLENQLIKEINSRINEMVRRYRDLNIFFVKQKPRSLVLKRLREALQCYIYGFFQGCAILCRSTLEKALGERINKVRDQEPIS